jgi:hypothetical protein
MATLSMNYASAATITLTLTSLTNGSWRASTAVDNTSNLYLDAILGGSVQMGTSPTNNGTFDIYLYSTYDGTNYTGGVSGTDAAYTADGEEKLFVLVKSIIVDNTTDQDYVWGSVSVAAAFGGTLPSKWGVVVENNTGVTTNATGTNNETQFIGTKLDSA